MTARTKKVPGVVVHTCNLNTLEAEVRGFLWVRDQPRNSRPASTNHSETLSQRTELNRTEQNRTVKELSQVFYNTESTKEKMLEANPNLGRCKTTHKNTEKSLFKLPLIFQEKLIMKKSLGEFFETESHLVDLAGLEHGTILLQLPKCW